MARRKDDTPRIFDVSKPNRFNPSPISRPIIVGHRPMMPDPMVNERPLHHHPSEPAKVTSVPVMTDEGHPVNSFAPTAGVAPVSPLPPDLSAAPAQNTAPQPELPHNQPESFMPPAAHEEDKPAEPITQQKPMAPPAEPPHPETNLDQSHLAGSLAVEHPPGAGPQSYWRKPLIWLAFLIILLIGYAVADAKTGLPLPLHLFREAAPLPVVSVTPPPAVTDPYAGWILYENKDYSFKLQHPKTWTINTLPKPTEPVAAYNGAKILAEYSLKPNQNPAELKTADQYSVSVRVIANTTNISPEVWFTDASKGGMGEGVLQTGELESKTPINNQLAYSRYSPVQGYSVYVISTGKNLAYISILASATPESELKSLIKFFDSDYKKIVNSFLSIQ